MDCAKDLKKEKQNDSNTDMVFCILSSSCGGGQMDTLKSKIKPPMMTVVGFPAGGKEQPVSSIVQTPLGERRMGDLKKDDYVIGLNGNKTKVIGTYPQGIKDVYQVTLSDGFSERCGIDHLWTVRNQRGKAKTLTTKELMNGYIYKCGKLRYKLPICDPVVFENENIELDPYILGVLIGDGYLSGGVVSFSVANFDSFILDKVTSLLPDGFCLSARSTGPNVKQFCIKSTTGQNWINRYLGKIGLKVKSLDKFIPDSYKYSSIDSRVKLLNGLMDTDGSCHKNSTKYSTKSLKLAQDISWLVQSLGGIAIIRTRDRTHHNKGIEYSVNIKPFFNPFSLPRKSKEWTLNPRIRMARMICDIKKLDYQEESVCIKVDAKDELYLTGNFIVTHNTTLAAMFPRPLFIQAEDASTVFESWPVGNQPDFLPNLPEKVGVKKALDDQLLQVYQDEHDFKTLVIDTVSTLQALFESQISFEEGDKPIADCLGGYQKAYDVIAGWHRELIQKCLKIRAKRGMTIVLLAHAQEYKRKNHPEIADQYTVYGMRMHQKSRDVYISESDMVIYIKQKDIVLGAEVDKKGKQTKSGRLRRGKDRVLITSSDGLIGYVDAKSRYMMDGEIDYVLDEDEPWATKNPLLEQIPFFKQGDAK